MIIYNTFEVSEIFGLMEQGRRSVQIDNWKVGISSPRIQLFHQKGTTCVRCGLDGNLFVLESHVENQKPHFNLYHDPGKGGERVLFTKDHIMPKSLGGSNTLENYQTMCGPCNFNKGSKWDGVEGVAVEQNG